MIAEIFCAPLLGFCSGFSNIPDEIGVGMVGLMFQICAQLSEGHIFGVSKPGTDLALSCSCSNSKFKIMRTEVGTRYDISPLNWSDAPQKTFGQWDREYLPQICRDLF